MIILRLPNGEPPQQVTPYQASDIFVKKYVPDLDSFSLEFLTVSCDTPVPFPVFNTIKDLENHITEVLKNVPKENEKEYSGIKHIITKYKGEKSEVAVQQYIKSNFSIFDPKVLIAGYKREQFCGFFKNYQCDDHKKGESQEFDIVLLLGQCRTLMVLEIKNEQRFSEKVLSAIDRTLTRLVRMTNEIKDFLISDNQIKIQIKDILVFFFILF